FPRPRREEPAMRSLSHRSDTCRAASARALAGSSGLGSLLRQHGSDPPDISMAATSTANRLGSRVSTGLPPTVSIKTGRAHSADLALICHVMYNIMTILT